MYVAASLKERGGLKRKTLKKYAAQAGLSVFHYSRSLVKIMSITPATMPLRVNRLPWKTR